ncbi:MAG: NAD(P)H-binding protein [bacterium]|nr:NAD(P)H-binding protein [bacterium]
MSPPEINVVTGAFGYTGKYITQRLLALDKQVRSLTGHSERENPFGARVSIFPFNFNNKTELVSSLTGATTIYNSYWIRFPYKSLTYDQAVENTKILINAAEEAGVHKFVHISITNASEESPLPYFKGKGLLEKALISSKLSYAIIRPTVIFGKEDILINNIAWGLRRFPLFPIFGQGDYRIQPIYVEDMAELAINAAQKKENIILDAVGPEIYTYEELVRLVAEKIRSKAKLIHLYPGLAYLLNKIVGYLVNDIVLTKDEITGLMANLLVSNGSPTGQTRISDWLARNADTIGIKYASEIRRHYR